MLDSFALFDIFLCNFILKSNSIIHSTLIVSTFRFDAKSIHWNICLCVLNMLSAQIDAIHTNKRQSKTVLHLTMVNRLNASYFSVNFNFVCGCIVFRTIFSNLVLRTKERKLISTQIKSDQKQN